MKHHEFEAMMRYVMATDPSPDDHVVTSGINQAVCDMLDREARERGYDSWVVAYHEFNPDEPGVYQTETTTILTETLIGTANIPPAMVWLTRINPWINGGTSRVLVNLDTVDAIVPDDDYGATLYWMSGQTSWKVTEAIETIYAMMHPHQ